MRSSTFGISSKLLAKHATDLGVFIAALLILFISMTGSAVNVYDEGIVVYGAKLIADGNVPYKDFWTIYSPAQFWVIGGLFKIFGPSIFVERVWSVVVRALISLTVYLLAKRYTDNYMALFVWFLCVLWLSAVGGDGFPVLPALLLIMVSATFFLNYITNKKSSTNLLYAGFLSGAAATFRHDLGFYTFASQVITILFFQKQIFGSISDDVAQANPRWKDLLKLSAGAAIVGIPTLIYLVNVAPLENIIEQLIVFPATVYREVRTLPYPSLLEAAKYSLIELQNGTLFRPESRPFSILPYYFHFITVLIGGLSIIHYTNGNNHLRKNANANLATAYLCILIMLLFIKSTVRPHTIQLIHVIIPALLLGGIIAANYAGRFRSIPSIIIVVLMLGMAVQPANSLYRKTTKYLDSLDCHSLCIEAGYRKLFTDNHEISRADYFNLDEDQLNAIEFIRAHTEPWEKIYVGNVSHRKVFVSDVLFYFLAERDSATMYHELHPGQITTNAVQQDVVNSLQRWNTRYVVLLDKWENVEEPNGSSKISSAVMLDKYLSDHYSEVAKFGNYSIQRRE